MKLEKFKQYEIQNLIAIKGGYGEDGEEEVDHDEGGGNGGGSNWWWWIIIPI